MVFKLIGKCPRYWNVQVTFIIQCLVDKIAIDFFNKTTRIQDILLNQSFQIVVLENFQADIRVTSTRGSEGGNTPCIFLENDMDPENAKNKWNFQGATYAFSNWSMDFLVHTLQIIPGAR